MSKYHVNPGSGNPGICSAAPGNCPFGADTIHYKTAEEARSSFEEAQSSRNIASIRRKTIASPKDVRFNMKYDEVLEVFKASDFEELPNTSESKGWRRILWNSEGFLAVVERAYGGKLKRAQVYYNWMPNNRADYLSDHGGSYNENGVWSGSFNAEDGLIDHLRRLREKGAVLPQWEEPPFTFLVPANPKEKVLTKPLKLKL